ncbi:PREDICTED: beclin-1-like protein A [Polistes canadensis]|uniref:beclin-1-like protein A n=1 Tax=Polistes canadensis TaxID=91411 RepID=UPI000718D50A|nr:PREDICTED: beclin-1-like protein A [Polistes canadensis]
MIGLIELLTITSALRVIVAEELSRIDDVQACTEFCFTYGNIGNFKDGNCVCENLDNTDAKNAIRGNRETECVDPTSDSNELTNEDRAIRCALRSRKQMRHHDADRVVTYFVNGGPANGHAYFVQAANQNMNLEKECNSDKYPSTNSYLNLDESNNQTPDEQPSTTNIQTKRSYRNDVPYNQYNPVYFLPNKMPIAPVVTSPYGYVMATPYNTVIEPKNNMLRYRASSRNNLVNGKLSPRTRSRTNILRRVSDALHEVVQEPVNDNLLGSFLNNLIYQDRAEYSSNYNNNKNVVNGNNIENETKQVNSIVGSTSKDDKTPITNSKTALQENIQRTSTSPTNFQNIPYNEQWPIYASQYLIGSPMNGFYDTMPRAFILQPVNIIPQGMHSMAQSEVINSSQPQESENCDNNNLMNTDESISTSNCSIKSPDSNVATIENTKYSSITK